MEHEKLITVILMRVSALVFSLLTMSQLIHARDISNPQIQRTTSSVSIQFQSRSFADYRIYSDQRVVCETGTIQAGPNRILLPKASSNERFYVKIVAPGRSSQSRENDILVPAKPYFSPLRKVENAAAIYQLPPRTYLASGTGRAKTGKLRYLTTKILKQIRDLGVDYLWLTGILEHANPKNIDPDVIKGQAGSYYAVSDNWDIAEDLGTMADFDALMRRAHSVGLRVLLDFIPNHTARVHETDVACKDEINFGKTDRKDRFFDPQNNYFYLGRSDGALIPPYQAGWPGVDGVFDVDIRKPGIQYELPAKVTGNNVVYPKPPANSWFETAKINYGYNFQTKQGDYSQIPKTWKTMLDIARYWLAKGVDGFRVDYAHAVPLEFWKWFSQGVKSYNPNTFLLAEAYEADTAMKVPGFTYDALYASGFDSVYNSKLYWSLRRQALSQSSMYTAALSQTAAMRPFFRKYGLLMTHYVENHDELRVAHKDYAPSLNNPMDRARNGWSQFVYAALLPGNVLIHGGQEVAEDASVVGPYAKDNGRTSIFDYVYQSQTLKWLKGSGNKGMQSLRDAYKEVLRFKHHPPFVLRHGDAAPSFIDLLSVNAWKEQNNWIASYLRFDKNAAYLVVSNGDPYHEHEATVHFTSQDGQDTVGALRAMKISPSPSRRYVFVEALSRRGWTPQDPNIPGRGIPGSFLYRKGGVPSGFYVGKIPARTTYVFKIVTLEEYSRNYSRYRRP